MSALDNAAPEPAPLQRGSGAGRLVTRWLPAIVVLLAVLGAVAVFPSIGRDRSARDYYRGQLGGSSLFSLDTTVARLMPFLIGASIGVALLQRQGRRRQHADTGASVLRHERTEVVTHWLNAIGIGLGLITAAWLLRWLRNPVSLETAYVLHFAGAGLTLAAVAHHLTYQLVGGGAGLIPRSRADVKNALAETIGYAGVYRGVRGVFGMQMPLRVRLPLQRQLRRLNIAPDPAGKYLATEKVLSYTIWALLIGVVVVTGIVKTLDYLYPLPGGLRRFMTFFHDGATIFLLIFLAFHVGALLLVPRNWPLLKSMLTTRISRAYVKEHLPNWTEVTKDRE